MGSAAAPSAGTPVPPPGVAARNRLLIPLPVTILTIFTAPKAFSDPHIATIQRNAILSWLHLGEQVEVLLVGEEAGMAQVAREYGVTQLANVRRNQAGTPLVSSIFELAQQRSTSPLLTYINADVMLVPDFVTAAHQVAQNLERFLLIGQRWDLDVRQVLDFSPGWGQRLLADVHARGQLHPPAGSDYFVFPRALFSQMPEFAIGRAGWDNWMIYHARRKGYPVIDGTPSITVIHQDHDYSHLPGGRPHYEQPESFQNEALAGGFANLYMVLDSDKQLIGGQVRRPRMTWVRTLRYIEMRLTPPDGQR
ncbi:MAG: hypothetical protein ACWGO1_02565, partial [Anaerolineales bacterium]